MERIFPAKAFDLEDCKASHTQSVVYAPKESAVALEPEFLVDIHRERHEESDTIFDEVRQNERCDFDRHKKLKIQFLLDKHQQKSNLVQNQIVLHIHQVLLNLSSTTILVAYSLFFPFRRMADLRNLQIEPSKKKNSNSFNKFIFIKIKVRAQSFQRIHRNESFTIFNNS